MKGRTFNVLHLLPLIALFALGDHVVGATAPLPPAPADYVLDEAGVLDSAQRAVLSHDLKRFDRERLQALL